MALMTTEEAAKYLGYSEYSLRKSRSKGQGTLGGKPAPPFVRIGPKTIRYKQEDLDEWIESLQSLGAVDGR